MGLLFKKYKTKFRYALKPVFSMLAAREKKIQVDEWKLMVERMRTNINNNPTEFLGTDLPEEKLMTDILDEIFKEFSQDLKIKRRSSSSS